jgi:hypothetical protein
MSSLLTVSLAACTGAHRSIVQLANMLPLLDLDLTGGPQNFPYDDTNLGDI